MRGSTVPIRAVIKVVLVFLFMAFLAAQAATGFMHILFAGSGYPRAMRAVDWMLETFVTGPLGNVGGALVLLTLGLGFAALVWRHATSEDDA